MDIVIIVYDLSQKNSLEIVYTKWFAEVEKFCKKDVIVLVVGNKNDKVSEVFEYYEKPDHFFQKLTKMIFL
jgi:GTPase SAR1 family protein